MAELTQAGHDPGAYEVIRQALIRTYVPEHDPGQNAAHLFAYIHDAGLRLVPAQVRHIDGPEEGGRV